jgi:hypothetical protein
MSLLDLKSRPTVYFDAANREHRSYYMAFLQNRSWRECPVQFYLERGYGDLASMVENKLSAFYLHSEFSELVPDRSQQWKVSA